MSFQRFLRDRRLYIAYLMETLSELNATSGVTIALVTHDPFAASYCRRILFIRDGELYNEIHRGENRQVFFQQILDVLALIGGGGHEFA